MFLIWKAPFRVLGSLVGPCGSAWDDFLEAEAAVWRRVWAGAASRKATKLPTNLKQLDVARVCWPALLIGVRGGPWAPRCSVAFMPYRMSS